MIYFLSGNWFLRCSQSKSRSRIPSCSPPSFQPLNLLLLICKISYLGKSYKLHISVGLLFFFHHDTAAPSPQPPPSHHPHGRWAVVFVAQTANEHKPLLLASRPKSDICFCVVRRRWWIFFVFILSGLAQLKWNLNGWVVFYSNVLCLHWQAGGTTGSRQAGITTSLVQLVPHFVHLC